MKRNRWKLVVPVAVFGVAMAMPAFAQNDRVGSAGREMQEAGEATEQVGVDAAAAAKHTYRAAKVEVKDTTITAKVKTSLHDDKTLGDADVHVSTTDGIVTLKGSVPSPDAAARAQKIAEQIAGVKGVNNRLTVGTETAD